MNYRHQARGSLKRAKSELETGDDERLKFAALELRMAMEALTYDRALAYKDEFPPEEYETWQPRKVLAVLLEIDATADKDSTIAVGIEEEVGKPAKTMQSLGTDKVLNMQTLKKHYDALGSYLHMPSIKQSKSGKPVDFKKFRARCEKIAEFIEAVLASPVFNVTLGNFATIECMECSAKLRKRMPHGVDSFEAECFECRASYTVTDQADGQVHWEPHVRDIACSNPDCGHKIHLWRHEVQAGAQWTCPECGGVNTLTYAVRHTPASETGEGLAGETQQDEPARRESAGHRFRKASSKMLSWWAFRKLQAIVAGRTKG